MENLTSNTPRIYVACLSAYNNGILHGAWIDATQDIDAIWAELRAILASSPMSDAEEWAIHDFEFFGGMRIEEYTGIDRVVEIAEFISDHGDLGGEIATYYGGDLDDAKNALEDYYHGEHDSEVAFATSLFEDCYLHEIPDHLHGYIDYEAFARDIFIDSYFSMEVDGKTHVFSYH